jgi:uncharacterized protein (DUF1501 family)
MNHPNDLPRRDFLKLASVGALSSFSIPWFGSLAQTAEVRRPRGKACILLWTDGGMSQSHTFDPRPAPIGEFRPAPTSVPGIHIAEQFPQVAQCMEDIILLRTMDTGEGNHFSAKYNMHTGFRKVAGLEHPCIGSIAASQLAPPDSQMPGYVTIDAGMDIRTDGGGQYRPAPGYLGARYAPLVVREPAGGVENLRPVDEGLRAGLDLLNRSEERFAREYPLPQVSAHQSATARAVQLMQSPRGRAFNLEHESANTREMYGPHRFGQSCMLARRLVEAGISFVEVHHRGWDDHENAATAMAQRAPWFDRGIAALIRDLKQRGMLDDTLVVCMGEFGRDVPGAGGHNSTGWSILWAGGGLKTGQVIGRTNDRGQITDRPITLGDYMTTLCMALGINTHVEFDGPGNRPMPVVEPNAKPITEVLG